MSMMHPLPTSERSRNYYRVRSVVRFVFWTAVFGGMIFWAGHIGGGKVL